MPPTDPIPTPASTTPVTTEVKKDDKNDQKAKVETIAPPTEIRVVEKEIVYEQVIVEVPVGITAQQRQQITMLASVSGMDSQQQFKFLDQLFKIIS